MTLTEVARHGNTKQAGRVSHQLREYVSDESPENKLAPSYRAFPNS
jgi:hypothetical protein